MRICSSVGGDADESEGMRSAEAMSFDDVETGAGVAGGVSMVVPASMAEGGGVLEAGVFGGSALPPQPAMASATMADPRMLWIDFLMAEAALSNMDASLPRRLFWASAVPCAAIQRSHFAATRRARDKAARANACASAREHPARARASATDDLTVSSSSDPHHGIHEALWGNHRDARSASANLGPRVARSVQLLPWRASA